MALSQSKLNNSIGSRAHAVVGPNMHIHEEEQKHQKQPVRAEEDVFVSAAKQRLPQDVQPYKYASLDHHQKQIRALHLQFDSHLMAPLEASLRIVNLAEDLFYNALSYMWEDPVFADDISVDGKKLPITRSLGRALRHIRQHQEGSYLRIWADSICIDQANILERNH